MKTKKIFEIARRSAENSDYTRVQIGCVAIYKNHIIAIGHNSYKTNPMQQKYNINREDIDRSKTIFDCIHAETSVIAKICNMDINFEKVEIYVYRIRRDRPHGCARPCKACMAMLKDYGIKKIHYTTNDGVAMEVIKK